jgi:hypothetical protein
MSTFVNTGALYGQRCKTALEELHFAPFTTAYSMLIIFKVVVRERANSQSR